VVKKREHRKGQNRNCEGGIGSENPRNLVVTSSVKKTWGGGGVRVSKKE